MSYLLALDQGTSSSRSIVFDATGRIVAMAQRELRQIYPQPGWVEHDPLEIWNSQLATAREALHRAGLAAASIRAIGITNQRETTVVWERRTGRPVHNAIVWQDRRTAQACAALREQGLAETVLHKTGLRIDPYFSGTKIAWILDHVPGARARAEAGELAFGTIDSWLIWQLTGGAVHATDHSNASRTLLLDLQTRQWDSGLLAALRVPAAMMPEVLPSSTLFGDTLPELLGTSLPIAGVAGDQQSALFGQACFKAGMAKNTYGTGCFLLSHTGERFQTSSNGLITTAVAQVGAAARGSLPPGGAGPALGRPGGGAGAPTLPAARGSLPPEGAGPALGRPGGGAGAPTLPATGLASPPQFALEGSVFMGGAVVQWLRDGLKAIRSSSEAQALAESVPDAGGVVLVPAFTGLGAPYWQPEARAAIVGLSRGSTMAHIARAALESIAFQSAALLQAMNRDAMAAGGVPVSELRVDGGASVNDLLMQIQADLLGIPVVRPAVTETTALGAAYLAGLQCGLYTGLQELAGQWRADRTFYPTLSRDRAAERMAEWEHAVRQTVAA
ncbi:MAG: glycerol kinase [Hydrogenophaga sp.]